MSQQAFQQIGTDAVIRGFATSTESNNLVGAFSRAAVQRSNHLWIVNKHPVHEQIVDEQALDLLFIQTRGIHERLFQAQIEHTGRQRFLPPAQRSAQVQHQLQIQPRPNTRNVKTIETGLVIDHPRIHLVALPPGIDAVDAPFDA